MKMCSNQRSFYIFAIVTIFNTYIEVFEKKKTTYFLIKPQIVKKALARKKIWFICINHIPKAGKVKEKRENDPVALTYLRLSFFFPILL